MTITRLSQRILSAFCAAAITIACGSSLANTAPADNDTAAPSYANERAPSLPLYFEENIGQTDPSVRFVNRSGRSTTFLRGGDIVTRLGATDPKNGGGAVVQMQFVGANDGVKLQGSEGLEGKSAYFRGKDPDSWITGVEHYARVSYDDISPGIDVVFHGHEGALRYDFHVAPQVDPDQIRLGFEGIEGLEIAEDGNLVLKTISGDVVHKAPVVYQDIDEERVFVRGEFRIENESQVLFALADYDDKYALVIDPVISYSTYLGGSGNDSGRSVRVDPRDQTIVVTGQTDSLNFPRVLALQSTHGSSGGGTIPYGWVPNPNGTDATYLWDQTFGRTDTHSVKITASTRPASTLNNPGLRTAPGQSAIFIDVSKTYTTSVWVYSSDGGIGHIPAVQFFDGFNSPIGTIGATVPSGFTQPANTWVQRSFTFTPSQIPAGAVFMELIVVQDIDSTQGTSTSVFFDDVDLREMGGTFNLITNPSFGQALSTDVFVSKLSADGSALIFSTYLGGSDTDTPQNVELDSIGDIIVVGRTSSADFPTASAAQPVYAGPSEDGFISKLTYDGSSLVYSTYVGGNDDMFFPLEEVRGVIIDSADNAFIIGNTAATDFFTTPGTISACVAADVSKPSDIFVRKYSPAGAILLSSCFGGTTRDAGRNISFDSSGNLFATGWTESSDFPTSVTAVQPVFAGAPTTTFPSDGWVARLNSDATAILASTYLGGFGTEYIEGLGVDSSDNVVVSGASNASDYPTTPGAFQTTYGGSSASGFGDAVVSKLNSDLSAFVFSTYLGGSGDDFAWGLKQDVEDRVYLAGFTDSADFPTLDPIQATLSGPQDVFVTQMAALGDSLDFSTYLGGSDSDSVSNGITVLNPGNVFVTGSTSSTDYPVVDPLQAVNAGGSDAFITRISTPVTVPVDDCTTTAGGCNPTGGLQITLPPTFVLPPGAEITQTPVPQDDNRVVNGRCDGVTELSLFNGDLIIPGFLCGGDDGFTVLVTETVGVDIREGVVENVAFAEVFSPDALICEDPIAGDRLLQDVGVWQTTNKANMVEKRAIENSYECGTVRSRTRTLSYFVIGMFIDFGLGPNATEEAVTAAFANLLVNKSDALVTAVDNARPALGFWKYLALRARAGSIRRALRRDRFRLASFRLRRFQSLVGRVSFDTSVPFNHEGNLISRSSNMKFTLDVKVIPFAF